MLPGIIGDRLFAVFDVNKDGFVDLKEFISGMSSLFGDTFFNLAQLVFNVYDFDSDGLISTEDVRTVLSYVPINSSYMEKRLKLEKFNFKDRVESQKELSTLLEKTFKGQKSIDFTKFIQIIEEINSDIMLFLLIYLLESRPFSKKTLQEYTNKKSSKSPETLISPHYVASPSLKSKFTPSLTISKTPLMQKKQLGQPNKPSSILGKYAGLGKPKPKESILDKYAKKGATPSNEAATPSVSRKLKTNLKDLEKVESTKRKNPVVQSKNENMIEEEDSDDEEEVVRQEGFLYKITETNRLKKLWFKLFFKDLYCFCVKRLQEQGREDTQGNAQFEWSLRERECCH